MPADKASITSLVQRLLKRMDECSMEQLSALAISISKHQHLHP